MAKYMLLIHGDETTFPKMTKEEQAKGMEAYRRYHEDLVKAGKFIAGEPLLPSAMTGAKVRVRAGKRTVTDGPFTETKEVIAGYFLIDAKSKEDAVEWAARCPGAEYGTMEVREISPIM